MGMEVVPPVDAGSGGALPLLDEQAKPLLITSTAAMDAVVCGWIIVTFLRRNHPATHAFRLAHQRAKILSLSAPASLLRSADARSEYLCAAAVVAHDDGVANGNE